MKKMLFNLLEAQGILGNDTRAAATNEIRVVGDDIVLSGNRLGLILLADCIVDVALSNTQGAHIHLDESNFFDDAAGRQLIIECTDN